MRKSDYAKLFTLRSDGYYQKKVKGKVYYDKDPKALYDKIQAVSKPVEKPQKTFKEVARAWELSHREEITPQSWDRYRPHFAELVNIYGDLPITQVSAQDVAQDIKRTKIAGYSGSIIKMRKSIFTQILDKALVDGDIPYNPGMSVKLPKGLKKGKRSAPTEQEMSIVVKNVDRQFGFYAFFLLFTGCRRGEALALKRNDIDLIHKTITISKAVVFASGNKPILTSPKTEAGIRIIPIVAALYVPLSEYLADLAGDVVFPYMTKDGGVEDRYMTSTTYKNAWKEYCVTSGLTITAHQLRHGTATIMFEAGVDVYTTRQILGHADITTTMKIYTDLREKQKVKSVEKFDIESRKYLADLPKGV